jgi:hypothetical protein
MSKEAVVDLDALDGVDVEAEDDAISRMEAVAGGTSGEDPDAEYAPANEAPKKSRARSRRKPPANLDAPVLEAAVILRLISFGKSITNVTATLGFELGAPTDMSEFMGEQAFAATFRGDYLGEGLTVRSEATSVDADNSIKRAFKVMLPRWNNGMDQLATYIAPLLPDDVTIDGLLGLSTAWRLNVTVEMGGVFALHAMQQSFDLTKKAE